MVFPASEGAKSYLRISRVNTAQNLQTAGTQRSLWTNHNALRRDCDSIAERPLIGFIFVCLTNVQPVFQGVDQ